MGWFLSFLFFFFHLGVTLVPNDCRYLGSDKGCYRFGTLSFFWLVFVCWHDKLYKINRGKGTYLRKKSQEKKWLTSSLDLAEMSDDRRQLTVLCQDILIDN